MENLQASFMIICFQNSKDFFFNEHVLLQLVRSTLVPKTIILIGLSTPRSLGIDPTFMDFNLKKTIGETDNIRDEIKHALNEQRIPIKTLGLSEVKINMK